MGLIFRRSLGGRGRTQLARLDHLEQVGQGAIKNTDAGSAIKESQLGVLARLVTHRMSGGNETKEAKAHTETV